MLRGGLVLSIIIIYNCIVAITVSTITLTAAAVMGKFVRASVSSHVSVCWKSCTEEVYFLRQCHVN